MGGYIVVLEEVKETWSGAASAGDHYDIFEIEAIGPALILHNVDGSIILSTMLRWRL